MNPRPSGYEPDELPDCSTPRYMICSCQISFSTALLQYNIAKLIMQADFSGNAPISVGAEDRDRTGTGYKARRILSPVRLPVPPLRHVISTTL